MTIEIFTDGACRGNPGPGGWGVLIRESGQERQYSGFAPNTTNNRMELIAAIEGLSLIPAGSNVAITTDSKYVMQGITEWLIRWRQNNWKTANKKPVKNQDLWQKLDVCVRARTVSWSWVKGHSGNRENEIVDQLATQAIENNDIVDHLCEKLS